MILVIGGTGTVGSEVLSQLRERGEPARALVRSPEKAAEVGGDGVEAVVGDLAAPETVEAALDGVDRVFFVLPGGPDHAALETSLVDAVAQHGGIRIVKLSVIGADPESPVRFGAQHGAVERHLAGSGVPHTLLRPNDFMQNAFYWAPTIKGEGKVYTPNADVPIASVDARDIAGAAVAALTGDGQEGKVYELSGPEALTRREQVARVAEAVGREIEVVGVSNEQARDAMLGMGYPQYTADGLYELFTNVYDPGYADGLSDGVQQATGRAPRSWADFARDHAAAWR